jgi:hypothetical protein
LLKALLLIPIVLEQEDLRLKMFRRIGTARRRVSALFREYAVKTLCIVRRADIVLADQVSRQLIRCLGKWINRRGIAATSSRRTEPFGRVSSCEQSSLQSKTKQTHRPQKLSPLYMPATILPGFPADSRRE